MIPFGEPFWDRRDFLTTYVRTRRYIINARYNDKSSHRLVERTVDWPGPLGRLAWSIIVLDP
jgi:hypothetical protein